MSSNEDVFIFKTFDTFWRVSHVYGNCIIIVEKVYINLKNTALKLLLHVYFNYILVLGPNLYSSC